MNEIEQRTEEWFKARLGKVTASKVADVIAKTKTGYAATRETYMTQLVLERITNKKADIVEEPKKQSVTKIEKITPISDQQKEVFPAIEPKQVNEAVAKLSTKQQIQDLIPKMKKPEDAQSIIDLKRKAKKAWDHFGIDEALVKKIMELSVKK